jgi:xanthine dehydrogenase YagR molybdenum-binding subunit
MERHTNTRNDGAEKYSHFAHSAVFAEVKVMWGLRGSFPVEIAAHTVTDHRFGRFMTHNLAGLLCAGECGRACDRCHLFVEEKDDKVNPLGVKGVGEIGIVGTAAEVRG